MVVYKIKNKINNKVYIGQTTKTIESRWHNHCSQSKYNDSYFYRAIKKYGKENSIKSKISRTKKLKKQALGKNNPMYGKTHSKSSIIKNAVSNGSKEFIVCKKDVIIGKWINKTDCARCLNMSREQVRDCLKGRYKTSMGYTFKYCE